MKTTKAFKLDFINTRHTTQYINVPFEVQTIKCINSVYHSTAASGHNVGYLSSTLTQNEPLTIFHQDKDFTVTNNPTTFELRNPQVISGDYQFSISIDPVGTDSIIIFLEFTG